MMTAPSRSDHILCYVHGAKSSSAQSSDVCGITDPCGGDGDMGTEQRVDGLHGWAAELGFDTWAPVLSSITTERGADCFSAVTTLREPCCVLLLWACLQHCVPLPRCLSHTLQVFQAQEGHL